MSQPGSFLTLPRELRDEILGYLVLPPFVYTSSSKPNTENLHRSKVDATTYIDTRIYLPSRIAPNVLGVCRQLRSECLQHHAHTLKSSTQSSFPSPSSPKQDQEAVPTSNLLAQRLGTENDEAAERLNDHCVRITLECQRAQRGKFGYFTPVRDLLSPRFLAFLPLISSAKKLRLVIWPGFDWWNGARPRAMKFVNGRSRIDESKVSDQPDAVSYAIGRVLDMLPVVEEVEVDIFAHVGAISRWDLATPPWEGIQYWLDGPVAREGTVGLKSVKRRLKTVWDEKKTEAFYVQSEMRTGGGRWHVKRRGDVRTPTVLALADPGELDGVNEVVDEEFERAH